MKKMLVFTESFGESKFKVVGVCEVYKREMAEEWRREDEANRDIWEVEVLT